jgi:hypothetical protein
MNFLYKTNSYFEVTHNSTKSYTSSVSLEQSITGPHSKPKKCSPHIPKLFHQKQFQYYYLLNNSLTPWSKVHPEKNMFSASQQIPRTLWKPQVHYHSHKCPPSGPTTNQIEPVHTTTSHFQKFHFNFILPFMPGSPQWTLSFSFPHRNPVYAPPLPHTHHMPCPSNSSQFYRPHNIGWGVQIIKLLIM